MKQIYILLTKTETLPSRLIDKLTHGSFTHTSVSLVPQTDRFYSYARRKIHNPLCAGLITENIHTDVFAFYPNCHCALFSLSVSDEAYERMEETVRFYLSHYKKATYNFLGLIPLRLGICVRRKFKLTCSQFVALILQASQEIQLPKDPYTMLPCDFTKITDLHKIYEGVLCQCNFGSFAQPISN